MSWKGSSKKVASSPLTHFVCIPLVNQDSRPQLERELRSLSNAIALQELKHDTRSPSRTHLDGPETVDLPRVHPKAIRPAGTIHCTLGVMSLADANQLQKAIDLLKSLDLPSLLRRSDLPCDTRLSVDLKGLLSMHSPNRTSILYTAPQDATGRLYPFCQAVQKAFKDSELLVPDDRPLKLHATIINTIYAKRGRPKPNLKTEPEVRAGAPPFDKEEPQGHVMEGGSNKRLNEQDRHKPSFDPTLSFDARVILEHYKDTIWAEGIILDRLAICEMGAKKILSSSGEVVDEVYTEVAAVPLPFL